MKNWIFRFFTSRKKLDKTSNMQSDSENKNRSEDEGFTYATLLVSFLSVIILICVIAFFQWHIRQKDDEIKNLLHNKDTEAAYKFTWVKNQMNMMTERCREKAEKIEQWQKYHSLNSKDKPPIELLTGEKQSDCVVAKEIPPIPVEMLDEKEK